MRISVAGVTDISDRTARALGRVEIARATQDRIAEVEFASFDGAPAGISGVRANAMGYAFNGATWDRIRSLRGGDGGRALAVGDPRYAATWGSGTYRTMSDFQRAPAAATQRVIYRIVNPAASGVTVEIVYIEAECNTARKFAMVYQVTVVTDRGTALSEGRKSVDGASAVATTSVDANVASDLGTPNHQRLLQANVGVVYTEPFQLEAGNAFDIQIGDVADATTDRMTLNLEWTEEAT